MAQREPTTEEEEEEEEEEDLGASRLPPEDTLGPAVRYDEERCRTRRGRRDAESQEALEERRRAVLERVGDAPDAYTLWNDLENELGAVPAGEGAGGPDTCDGALRRWADERLLPEELRCLQRSANNCVAGARLRRLRDLLLPPDGGPARALPPALASDELVALALAETARFRSRVGKDNHFVNAQQYAVAQDDAMRERVRCARGRMAANARQYAAAVRRIADAASEPGRALALVGERAGGASWRDGVFEGIMALPRNADLLPARGEPADERARKRDGRAAKAVAYVLSRLERELNLTVAEVQAAADGPGEGEEGEEEEDAGERLARLVVQNYQQAPSETHRATLVHVHGVLLARLLFRTTALLADPATYEAELLAATAGADPAAAALGARALARAGGRAVEREFALLASNEWRLMVKDMMVAELVPPPLVQAPGIEVRPPRRTAELAPLLLWPDRLALELDERRPLRLAEDLVDGALRAVRGNRWALAVGAALAARPGPPDPAEQTEAAPEPEQEGVRMATRLASRRVPANLSAGNQLSPEDEAGLRAAADRVLGAAPAAAEDPEALDALLALAAGAAVADLAPAGVRRAQALFDALLGPGVPVLDPGAYADPAERAAVAAERAAAEALLAEPGWARARLERRRHAARESYDAGALYYDEARFRWRVGELAAVDDADALRGPLTDADGPLADVADGADGAPTDLSVYALREGAPSGEAERTGTFVTFRRHVLPLAEPPGDAGAAARAAFARLGTPTPEPGDCGRALRVNLAPARGAQLPIWWKETNKRRKGKKSNKAEKHLARWGGVLARTLVLDAVAQGDDDPGLAEGAPPWWRGDWVLLVLKAMAAAAYAQPGTQRYDALVVPLDDLKLFGNVSEAGVVHLLRRYLGFALCVPDALRGQWPNGALAEPLVRDRPPDPAAPGEEHAIDLVTTLYEEWWGNALPDGDVRTWADAGRPQPFLFRPAPTPPELWRIVQWTYDAWFGRVFGLRYARDLHDVLYSDRDMVTASMKNAGLYGRFAARPPDDVPWPDAPPLPAPFAPVPQRAPPPNPAHRGQVYLAPGRAATAPDPEPELGPLPAFEPDPEEAEFEPEPEPEPEEAEFPLGPELELGPLPEPEAEPGLGPEPAFALGPELELRPEREPEPGPGTPYRPELEELIDLPPEVVAGLVGDGYDGAGRERGPVYGQERRARAGPSRGRRPGTGRARTNRSAGRQRRVAVPAKGRGAPIGRRASPADQRYARRRAFDDSDSDLD